MNTITIVILVLILICIYCLTIPRKSENFTSDMALSNEAIQTIASVYNQNSLTTANAAISNGLTANQITTANATINNGLTANQITTANATISNGLTANQITTANATINNGLTANTIALTGGLTSGTVNTTDLTVNGNLLKQAMIYRKNDPAGYFGISNSANRTVLYYGWNMMWSDDLDRTGKLRKYAGSSLPVVFSGMDLRNGSDNNPQFYPRSLIVYPGYIARLYYWDVPSTDRDVYVSGMYDFTTNPPGNGRRVHIICVTLAEDGPQSIVVNPSALTT